MDIKIIEGSLIFALILAIMTISGCTSSGVNPQEDIVNWGGDQVGPGQWNDQYHTEWFFTGNIKSKSGTKYSTVKLSFTAYDSSGNVVGTQNITTDMNNGMGFYKIIMKVNNTPDHINMTIINATKI